jgi:hypothetical protein
MQQQTNHAGEVIFKKPHKFFEAYLDNDLTELSRYLEDKYKMIEDAKLRGVTEFTDKDKYWVESGSKSTTKWSEYNVFQFYNPSIYKVYVELGKLVREACEYYDIDFASQQFVIQGWFNINKKGAGKLDWHEHGEPGAPNFHGYYCINAEPSITHYRLYNDENNRFDNINKNNRLIVSEMGHPHAQGDWEWDGSRITLAYDIVPLRLISGNSLSVEQHWIPLN